MKYLSVLITLLFLSLYSCVNTVNNKHIDNKHKDYSLLHLDDILDGYYLNSYQYPRTIDDLFLFTDKLEFSEAYKETINSLSHNKLKIIFKQKYDNLYMFIGFRLVYYNPCRTPCEELEYDYNIGTYVSRVLFFDNKRSIITFEESNVLKNKFVNGISVIKSGYKEMLKDNDINKHVMLQYVQNEGLSYFCNEDIKLSDYEYFFELESFLKEFMNTYELSKIIFMTPVMYKKK